MSKLLTILAALLLSAVLPRAGRAQKAPAEAPAVKQVVLAFFDGMRRGDSALVRGTLAPGAVFHGLGGRAGQPPALQTESIKGFLQAVGTPHPAVWDERVQFEQVLIDASLASVWAPYSFYLGPKLSHCGYDSFQLVKLAGGWKIAHIIDTRRPAPCP